MFKNYSYINFLDDECGKLNFVLFDNRTVFVVKSSHYLNVSEVYEVFFFSCEDYLITFFFSYI